MSDHERHAHEAASTPRAQPEDHGVDEVTKALNALPELVAPDRLWDDVPPTHRPRRNPSGRSAGSRPSR